jgi:rfaE bifunctional protein kinase chain/domain
MIPNQRLLPMFSLPIEKIIASFGHLKIAVIGDIMLDKYIFGHVSRISPEYPVPVVDVTHEDQRLGGAANVARNTLSLGAETYLIGVTGIDGNRESLAELFATYGLSADYLVSDASRPTTCKTRILSQNHHITRVDFESREPVSEAVELGIAGKLRALAPSLDAVIIEDYNKGLLTSTLVRNIIAIAEDNDLPVLVDPKLQGFFSYRGCSVFKPNLSEMASSLGMVVHNNDSEVEAACLQLQEKIEAESLVVTRSEKGITIFNGTFTHIPAASLEVADVSGAGDTVIGVLALGTAAGLDIVTSASIANIAAGTVCQEVGAVPVKAERLIRACQSQLI